MPTALPTSRSGSSTSRTTRPFASTASRPTAGWVSRKKAGKTPILYRLNTLAAADEIFIVNGEKAADRGAADLGIVTTCAPDGEGKWCGEYTKPLVGKMVRIVVDHDDKGEKHGKIVVRRRSHRTCAK